jgi:hypothetical protein
VSEQKAAMVGQQAPQGVSQAAEGKEKSAPLASESRNLSAEIVLTRPTIPMQQPDRKNKAANSIRSVLILPKSMTR